MLTESDIKAISESFAISNAREREIIIQSLTRAVVDLKEDQLLAKIMIVMRQHASIDLLEEFAGSFNHLPIAEASLKWELAYWIAIHGDASRALTYLEPLMEHDLLNNQRLLFVAVQYARVSLKEKAIALLDIIERSEPSLVNEVKINRQFFDLLWRYDNEQADTMLGEIFSRFKRESVSETEARIKYCIDNEIPYLLLRMGDGEGAHIIIDDVDESEYFDYYSANRREFLRIWFKNEDMISDTEYYHAVKAFNDAIANADCLGGIYADAIRHEFRLGSRRGIAWVVNTMRKAIQLSEQNPQWAQQTPIHHLGIHYDLLQSGALSRLLTNRAHVGLVSCQDELPEAMRRKFNIESLEFYKVPGEQIHSEILGAAAVDGSHWPGRFRELCSIFDEKVDRRGHLFLVAAGMLGKIYASKLKDAGAVVIDIGAVADYWVNKATRTFPPMSDEVSLKTHDPIVIINVGSRGYLSSKWKSHATKTKNYFIDGSPIRGNLRADIQSADMGSVFVNAHLYAEPKVITMRLTRNDSCSSYLEPNVEFLKQFSIASAFEVVDKYEVSCVRFDELLSLGKVDAPDVIQVVGQGADLQMIQGFGKTLQKCLAVKMRVCFYPMYAEQFLIGDSVMFLQQHGFALKRLTPIDHFDGYVVEADAFFMCTPDRANLLSDSEKEKLSLIGRIWDISGM